MANQVSRTLSELDLGIRELFRVVIPGAYTLVLFYWIGGQEVRDHFPGGMVSRAAIAVLAGLLAYGLRIHETWVPYKHTFNRHRQTLNAQIANIAEADANVDYVSEYKYFLEMEGPEIKERIHYFSSFYYMLVEMSVLSAFGGIAVCLKFFVGVDQGLAGWQLILLAAAGAVQILWLYTRPYGCFPTCLHRLRGYSWCYARTPRELRILCKKFLRYSANWLALTSIWIGCCLTELVVRREIWPTGPRYDVNWQFWSLVAAAFVFERLGAKQWESVIKEQKTFVLHRRAKLKEVMSASIGQEHQQGKAGT